MRKEMKCGSRFPQDWNQQGVGQSVPLLTQITQVEFAVLRFYGSPYKLYGSWLCLHFYLFSFESIVWRDQKLYIYITYSIYMYNF